MNLAIVTSHINRSTQWNWFSEELIQKKVNHIHIIINPTHPFLADDLKALGVPTYFLKSTGMFSHVVNLLKTIYYYKKHKIDIVHTELPMGNFIGQLAARICGIKMRVTTCENTTWAQDFNSKRQLFIDRYTFKSAKRVIAVTKEAEAYLHSFFRVPSKKLVTIHHSLKQSDYLNIDPSRIEKLKKELGVKENDFIIGMVARFEFWKGHIYAITAFRQLIATYPNLKLFIFGSKGENFDKIMNYIRDHKLENYIKYQGFVPDNIALFHIFDIHVHVPINPICETFGINIMEGMISGRAQVLTRSGISCMTARDGENCLVVDYCSSDEIYQALKKLIDDPELRKRLGAQANADAIKHFNYPDKVNQHLALYEEIRKEISK